MSKVHEIESVDEFNKLLESAPATTLVALNFHTAWAEPCKQMNLVFSGLASQASETSPILFVSVDAEELPDISESYDVSVVPYLVLLKASKVLERISGADPAGLASAIEKHSGTGISLPPPQQTTAPATTSSTTATNGSTTTENPSDALAVEEDITARLTKLVAAAPVMLFMKGTPAAPQCGFSRQLVAFLRERGVRYGFFNILADDEVRQGLKEFSDWPTYPQLYVKGQLVGGLDIVKEEFENDPEFLKNVSVNAKS